MVPIGGHEERLDRLLARVLGTPVYLSPGEARGEWRGLFPELASALPAPYPVFSPDEARVVAWGYPILVTESLGRLRKELSELVAAEVTYRLGGGVAGGTRKQKVMTFRGRFLEGSRVLMTNTLLADYGRGLFEVLVLHLSREMASAVSGIPRVARKSRPDIGRDEAGALRFTVASVLADLLQRSGHEAGDQLRAMARTDIPVHRSQLLAALCADVLPLALTRLPEPHQSLEPFLRARGSRAPEGLLGRAAGAMTALADVLAVRQELAAALRLMVGEEFDTGNPTASLQPLLWRALREMGILSRLGITPEESEILQELGFMLKRLELVVALRSYLRPVRSEGTGLCLASTRPPVPIARSTRPFDFARPGVVDTAVRRFGLVYDLTAFTQTLEMVRREGRRAEERALRFMFVFQQRVEEIRSRHRLTFEKFLGDGAFYSSRRALTTLVAAAEIQMLYDGLRNEGFPFAAGIRMALNFGTYHLLPMLQTGGGAGRFEFFGHGVVELARLTTGKSEREVEEIAEFLVHQGYSPAAVDDFLSPLMKARGGLAPESDRRYVARLDAHGELHNEGIVLTAAFVEELDRELSGSTLLVAGSGGTPWVVVPLEEGSSAPLYLGLSYLGVARLKGLPPLEIAEAIVWPGAPAHATTAPAGQPVLSLLRRLATRDEGDSRSVELEVPPDVVVATYLDARGERTWLFGRYRDSDDLLVETISVPLRPPDLERGEPLEMWLFRNRHELYRLYESLCRGEEGGAAVPLESLRRRDGYLGCFLTAPHRVPA